MKPILVAISCILLPACTSISNKAASIKETNLKMVKELNCKFLGKVSVTTSTRGQSFAEGINEAKNLAREEAADLGATHILWTDTERGFVSTVKGDAYYCSK